MYRCIFVLLVGALLLGYSPNVQGDGGDGVPSYFGSTERPLNKNIDPIFNRWDQVIARTWDEYNQKQKDDCEKGVRRCRYHELDVVLDTFRSKSARAQLNGVNAYLNRIGYVTDNKNWGVREYWATPAQFLSYSGDCEEFVVAKFFALRRLGWSDDTLRIVAAHDLVTKIGHVFLIADVDGVKFVLDNQIRKVVQANTVDRYVPVYSMNENGKWRHDTVKTKEKWRTD